MTEASGKGKARQKKMFCHMQLGNSTVTELHLERFFLIITALLNIY